MSWMVFLPEEIALQMYCLGSALPCTEDRGQARISGFWLVKINIKPPGGTNLNQLGPYYDSDDLVMPTSHWTIFIIATCAILTNKITSIYKDYS